MSRKELLHHYASAALQALITKFPLLDREGEYSKPITEKELQKIKIEIVESAYEYAQLMVLFSGKAEDWIDKNH